MSYNDYLQTHVSAVLGLTSTYYDPLEGSLALTDKKLSEGYRSFHDLTQSQTQDLDDNLFATSLCTDEFNMGAFCGTGGMVSSSKDMQMWYTALFVERNPALLSSASIDAILSPITLTGVRDTYDAYFGQGVGVDVRHGETSAYTVYYTGNLICSATSIRLLLPTPTDPAILSIVFRNSVVVNASQAEHTESQHLAEGTFYDHAFVTYGWESYGDSRVHAEDLAYYFRANPEAWTSQQGEGGDSSSGLSTGAITGVSVLCAVLLLVVGGAMYLLVWKKGEEEKQKPMAGGNNSSSSISGSESKL